jgi:hypothetical protein
MDINKHETFTNRNTYGLLDFLGDIGGLFEILKILSMVIVRKFPEIRLKALITSRLYHGSHELQTKVSEADGIFKVKKGDKSDKIHQRLNGDIALSVPVFLDWQLFLSKLCCCCKTNQFKVYHKSLEVGFSSF